jgi:hypothetical protein
MDRDTRTVALAVGIFFCVGFAALTVNYAVGARFGLGTMIITGTALVVNLMILLGLIGAIRNPPDDR